MMVFPHQNRHVRFRVDIAPNIPAFVVGDKTRLLQILLNLLGNAFKNTQEGEVTLRVTYEDMTENLIRFDIIDTGVGIDAEHFESIFDAFAQINPQKEGLGLGLTIVKKLVVASKGRISVQSEKGKGSTFSVILPLPPADVNPDEKK
jgi:signal transduction histidine kinase